jgi:hypothetical protein
LLCRPGGYCESVGRPITSSHVPQQFKPLGCVASEVTVSTLKVSTSHHLLSRPATVQTAGLCRPGCYSAGGGGPITSCHDPQQFYPLGCVAPVVTVRVSVVPSPPVTSRNRSNRWAVSPHVYSEGVAHPITSCHLPQQSQPPRCVASVVTVRVSGVPSPPVTSRNSSNSWAVSPRWLL